MEEERKETKNIFQKMLEITSEIQTVAKNLNVGFGKSTYKAVSEADVLAAVKPIEIAHGVYSYPFSREIIGEGEITNSYNGQEKRQVFMRLKVVYRFVNVDDPAEYIEIVSYGDGVDSQDKAPGKAMTYADKYALLKAYKIQTGEDPDQEASGTLVGKKSGITKKKAEELEKRCAALNINDVEILNQYGVSAFEQMTEEQYEHLSARLAKAEKK